MNRIKKISNLKKDIKKASNECRGFEKIIQNNNNYKPFWSIF